IVSNWKVDDGKFEWDVKVPEGTSAKVCVPQADGSREIQEVGPGEYHFSAAVN
ncbi:MAG: hypothetical protein IK076_01745, partial [Bacteroidales bacterium]|nr:hypothetical protein [Bacteroidales bacterium]